jgi:aryl-alcohol dehydrogenase-like predicted oxidoreductase
LHAFVSVERIEDLLVKGFIPAMEYRYLGSSGFKVSAIAYGNWITHGGQLADDVAHAIVRASLDAGITTFDTADVYANTRAEEVLGRALQGVQRGSIEILTKLYNVVGPGGHNDVGLSRKHVREAIEGSLRRLRTDYIDVYQAHRFDVETPLEETMQALADLVRQGKVLYIGVSEWTAEQLRAGAALAKDLGIQLVSNQPQYSILWRVIEERIVPASVELGISQIVFSPIAQGALTGKYLPGRAPEAGTRAADPEHGAMLVDRFVSDDTLTAVQRLVPLAAEAGLTMPQLAIAWVLQNPNVSSAIVGASRPEQISSNANAAGVRLDPSLLARIDAAVAGVIIRDPERTFSPTTRPDTHG